MHPAIFLDRDGVIIENRPDYVRSWDDVEFYPQALAALARISSSTYKIVIITNQSGIGRGLIPLEMAEAINRRLVEEIEKAGGRVDGVFMCPHRPADRCSCRKPNPGLILQAAQALSLDLSRSLLIGDAISDLRAGNAAGVPTVALVRTGRGAGQEHSASGAQLKPFHVYNTLSEALEDLVQNFDAAV